MRCDPPTAEVKPRLLGVPEWSAGLATTSSRLDSGYHHTKNNPFKTNSSPTEPSVLQSKTKAAHNLVRKEEGTSSYLLSRKPGSWDLCPLDPPSDLHSFHCCSVSWGHRGKEPRVKPGTGPGEPELCVMCACSLSVQSPRQSQGEGDADHHEDSPKWVPLGERLSSGCPTSMVF